jgi:hypothetical protein
MDHASMPWDTAAMAASGFTLSVVEPLLVAATRHRRWWRRLGLPAHVALPVFLLVHAAAVLGPCLVPVGTVVRIAAEAAVLAAGVWFWLPVMGEPHRLSGPGRCLYVFVAAPLLDLPAVGVIAAGRTGPGLAMIAAMLPIGLCAMTTTWTWITAEESRAAAAAVGGGRTRSGA